MRRDAILFPADALAGKRNRTPGIDPAGLHLALVRHSSERLGRIKQPEQFQFIDELPRSATGKLLRRTLRELVKVHQGDKQ